MYGPYINLYPGRYAVSWTGTAGAGKHPSQLLVISALSYTLLMSMIQAAALSRYHAWSRVAIGIAPRAALCQLIAAVRARRADLA